jgi:hypothetical protein
MMHSDGTFTDIRIERLIVVTGRRDLPGDKIGERLLLPDLMSEAQSLAQDLPVFVPREEILPNYGKAGGICGCEFYRPPALRAQYTAALTAKPSM